MGIKKIIMKKAIIFVTILALSTLTIMPALADSNNGIFTSLTADTSGGTAPIVKAKWEANADKYTDDSTAAGAQFNPSGIKDENKTIAICAVVTDPDGLADINNVYADVFYPENIKLGPSHIALETQSGLGCGQLMQEDKMTRLDKMAGINLFCDSVRNSNNNLPTFNTGYNYDEICLDTGELRKETAAVYCTQKDLSYEDPNGDYKVWALALDTNGKQGLLEKHFTYLPMTAFQTDFTSVPYASVRMNIHKIISGDKTWGNGIASVRNVGNTRLLMGVQQDDMGFGMTDLQYNVKFDGRVGSSASFVQYWPNANPENLPDALDLSEMNEMDFSILVSKFPPTHTDPNYTGTMTLSAISQAHLTCTPS